MRLRRFKEFGVFTLQYNTNYTTQLKMHSALKQNKSCTKTVAVGIQVGGEACNISILIRVHLQWNV